MKKLLTLSFSFVFVSLVFGIGVSTFGKSFGDGVAFVSVSFFLMMIMELKRFVWCPDAYCDIFFPVAIFCMFFLIAGLTFIAFLVSNIGNVITLLLYARTKRVSQYGVNQYGAAAIVLVSVGAVAVGWYCYEIYSSVFVPSILAMISVMVLVMILIQTWKIKRIKEANYRRAYTEEPKVR
jgi:hypothetical protein